MNLKNNHKEIYQRLSNEDTVLFSAVNEKNALITFDEYYERNNFASAIETIGKNLKNKRNPVKNKPKVPR